MGDVRKCSVPFIVIQREACKSQKECPGGDDIRVLGYVAHYDQVKIAVLIVVAPRASRVPLLFLMIFDGRRGNVCERPVAVVAKEFAAAVIRHVQVAVAVVVVVGGAAAVAPPRRIVHARRGGHVGKGAGAVVAVQGVRPHGVRDIDIVEAIVVVVQDDYAASYGEEFPRVAAMTEVHSRHAASIHESVSPLSTRGSIAASTLSTASPPTCSDASRS